MLPGLEIQDTRRCTPSSCPGLTSSPNLRLGSSWLGRILDFDVWERQMFPETGRLQFCNSRGLVRSVQRLFPTDPESHRSPFLISSWNFWATASSPPCSSVRQSQYGRIDSTRTLAISGAVFSVTSLTSTCLVGDSGVFVRSHVILKSLRMGLNAKLL